MPSEMERWRFILCGSSAGSLSYYRTADGTEVDFVFEKADEIIPVEVKWTENPKLCSLLPVFACRVDSMQN